METKFTPWRGAYIQGSAAPKYEGCALCALHQASLKDDASNFMLHRGAYCYVVLNLYPYNPGHLMVVPYTHTADFPKLEVAASHELIELGQRCVELLGQALKPDGFNLGINLGHTAGAGIAEHMHLHVVPRWGGDANFMPIIGGTKLVPEDLDATYAKLRPLFEGDGETGIQGQEA